MGSIINSFLLNPWTQNYKNRLPAYSSDGSPGSFARGNRPDSFHMDLRLPDTEQSSYGTRTPPVVITGPGSGLFFLVLTQVCLHADPPIYPWQSARACDRIRAFGSTVTLLWDPCFTVDTSFSDHPPRSKEGKSTWWFRHFQLNRWTRVVFFPLPTALWVTTATLHGPPYQDENVDDHSHWRFGIRAPAWSCCGQQRFPSLQALPSEKHKVKETVTALRRRLRPARVDHLERNDKG